MSAAANSPTGIVKRVSRCSQPGHGYARLDSYPSALSTARSFQNRIVIAAVKSPRPTGACHHLTATLMSPASTVNAAIKSP